MIKKIYSFRLRAGYPNYVCDKYFCALFLGRSSTQQSMSGHLPPEAEYRTEKDGEVQSITADYTDIPFLSDPDEKKNRTYLLHLVRASNGHKASMQYIENIKKPYYTERSRKLTKHHFTENRYVVPSNTQKKHSHSLVSHKGATLLDLTQEGYPVPDFCILSARFFLLSESSRTKHLTAAISNLEQLTGTELGSPGRPLIFAIRCALPEYIPGLMPTYLNVGVTDSIYPGLINTYGEDAAIKIYCNNLKTIYNILYAGEDDGIAFKVQWQLDGPMEEMQKKITYFHRRIAAKDKRLLTDAFYQFCFFTETARRFYSSNQDLIFTFQKGGKTNPALILQKMVWTVRDEESYPGVLYSRHSRTGRGVQVEHLKNIFGEDIMSGLLNTEHTEFFEYEEIRDKFPAVFHFCPDIPLLEKKLGAPVTVEFGAESFRNRYFFALLQLDVAEMSGRATLLTAIDMYRKKIISKKKVVKMIHPYHLRQIFSERIDDESLKDLQFFCSGISILPRSAVSARIFFSANKALEAKRKGEKVCFCKSTFTPMDRVVMSEVDAILSLTPAAIHVVTACLGYGIPAFINLEKFGARIMVHTLVNDKGLMINEGEWITISSKRKMLFIGQARYKPARFQKYLQGEPLNFEPREEAVFISMADAFREYQKIVDSLKTGEITKLTDLVKLIRNDLQKFPKKAEKFVNTWFDGHKDYYIHQILKSEPGSHLDQHRIYNLLTADRKVTFFKQVIASCKAEHLRGFKAGAFMLGRFMSQPHPIAFWKEMNAEELAFMLNEYILFEKYIQVLNDFDERHINRVRNEILSYGLGSIEVTMADAENFISLKISGPDWDMVSKAITPFFDRETATLAGMLRKPYGELFDYSLSWSLNKLKEACKNENVPVPLKSEV